MSIPTATTPPQPWQKFIFKPDTVVEFIKVFKRGSCSQPEWQFICREQDKVLLYETAYIIELLTDKHVIPI